MGSGSQGPPKVLAGGRFEVDHLLGEGCFGMVYSGLEKASGLKVAVKCEPCRRRGSRLDSCLALEAEILNLINTPAPVQGFVQVRYMGREGEFMCMAMDLLGTSLEDCVEKCHGQLNVKTTAIVGEQVLWRIEYLHSKCIIHRDIKPENFMWGIDRKIHHLHMIDFGLSMRYYNGNHVPMTNGHSLTGTVRYASITSQRGCIQSRRDDLEAIGHMLMYCLRGSLPWSGLKVKHDSDRNKMILEKKELVKLADLCSGYPEEFEIYLNYCRCLPFKERPDYAMLRGLFRAVREREGAVQDHQLQWLEGKDIEPSELLAIDTPAKGGYRQPDDLDELEDSKAPPRRTGCCLGGVRLGRQPRTTSPMDTE